MHKFQYLKIGLALVLAFVGTKMVLADIYKIPIAASLGVVAALITGSVILSLWRSEKDTKNNSVDTQPMKRRA
jgi:tellurite resistance protein TerC